MVNFDVERTGESVGGYLVDDSGSADCWICLADIAPVRDDKVVVEGSCYSMLELVVAVSSTDISLLAEYMSADSEKLEQQWHEHLSHFYHSSC